MKISKIQVLTHPKKADKLFLTTDLPNGSWPYHGVQTLELEVSHGEGLAYAHKNFPDADVVHFPTGVS